MNLIPGIGAGLLGLFGGGGSEPQMTDEQKAIYRRFLQLFKTDAQFSRSKPLSTTQEKQGLAEALGQFGQAARRGNEATFAGMSPTALQSPSVARAQQNLATSNQAQQGQVYSNAYQQGLERRDAVRSRLPGYLQGAAGIAGNPALQGQQSGVGDLLPLLQQFGMQWGQRQGQQQQQQYIPGTTTGDPYGSGFNPYGGRGGYPTY